MKALLLSLFAFAVAFQTHAATGSSSTCSKRAGGNLLEARKPNFAGLMSTPTNSRPRTQPGTAAASMTRGTDSIGSSTATRH